MLSKLPRRSITRLLPDLQMFPSLFAFKRPHLPDAFKPSCHIFYGQRILDVHDGTPKFEGHKDKSAVIAES